MRSDVFLLVVLLLMAPILAVSDGNARSRDALASSQRGGQAGVNAALERRDYRDRNFDYFVAGDPTLPRARRTEAGLALMGGGGSVDAAFSFIATHAGGGHIVILRAVSDDSFDPDDGSYGERFATLWGPVTSAETIVFHNRAASSDPRVLAALHDADGIFLAGGDQSNYVRYWKGTPVQDALNAHVRSRRPIGGSSAGLAVLGHYSYTAFDGGSMESGIALSDPFNAGMTLESDFLRYPLLERVITDTHFSARSRLGRLIAFVARLNQQDAEQKIVGLGIDEKTALLIGADGIGRLAPGSSGSAWLVEQTQAATLRQGDALALANERIVRLDGSSSIDMKSLTLSKPASATRLSIENGHPTQSSALDPILMRSVVPPHED